jgi:hypothetical protein
MRGFPPRTSSVDDRSAGRSTPEPGLGRASRRYTAFCPASGGAVPDAGVHRGSPAHRVDTRSFIATCALTERHSTDFGRLRPGCALWRSGVVPGAGQLIRWWAILAGTPTRRKFAPTPPGVLHWAATHSTWDQRGGVSICRYRSSSGSNFRPLGVRSLDHVTGGVRWWPMVLAQL